MSWLINTEQLEKLKKNQKHLLIFDASWYASAQTADDAKAQFLNSHLPDAHLFCFEDFYDKEATLPYTISHRVEQLSQACGKLGITKEHKVIFYDNSPLHSSARAWWILKYLGHNAHQLYWLDGGLTAWQQAGGEVTSGEPRPVTPKRYAVQLQTQFLCTLARMKQNVQQPVAQVIDVRHPTRFMGGKEERPHVRSGHIPGSFNFPYFTMFETNGCFKSIDKIRKQLIGIGVSLDYPIVTTCGSGITAPILNFVLDLLEHSSHALYDGSWTEWGADTLYPGETSLAERPIATSLIE